MGINTSALTHAVLEGNHQLSKQIVLKTLDLTEGDAVKAKELMHLALSQITALAEEQRKSTRAGVRSVGDRTR